MEIDYRSITVPILYRDEHLVAVDKPPGMLVHRSRIATTARVFALQTVRNQIGCQVYPIHRLDRPTSGILLFGLTREIARDLCSQFENRSVQKTYEAIVRGHPPDSGRIDQPLAERHDPKSDKRARHCKESQSAITEFECMRRWTVPFPVGPYESSRYAHVRLMPLTGRKHQIRRHLKHTAWPIIGDTTHGDRRHNRAIGERFGFDGLMLVARELMITHPATGRKLCFSAARGRRFQNLIASLDRLSESD